MASTGEEQTTDAAADDAAADTTHNAPDEAREGDGQDYIDRSSIDFDPDDGLLSGTAIDGTSDIPGPHEEGEGAGGEETASERGAAGDAESAS